MGPLFSFLRVSCDVLFPAKHGVGIGARHVDFLRGTRPSVRPMVWRSVTPAHGWAGLDAAAELESSVRCSSPGALRVVKVGLTLRLQRDWDLSASQTPQISLCFAGPATSFPSHRKTLSALQPACQHFEFLECSLCSLYPSLAFCTCGHLYPRGLPSAFRGSLPYTWQMSRGFYRDLSQFCPSPSFWHSFCLLNIFSFLLSRYKLSFVIY